MISVYLLLDYMIGTATYSLSNNTPSEMFVAIVVYDRYRYL